MAAQMTIPASPDQVWAVLTDYDHLEEFIPYLLDSQVVRKERDRLILRQEGGFWLPFYRLKTQVIFEVKERPPQMIYFRAVEGDFRLYEGSWHLERMGKETWLSYEATIEPDFWVPRWVLGELERQVLKGTFRAILQRTGGDVTPESSPAS